MFPVFLEIPDTSGYCLLNWLTNSTHPEAAVSFVMLQHIYRNYSRVQPFSGVFRKQNASFGGGTRRILYLSLNRKGYTKEHIFPPEKTGENNEI